MDTKDEGISQEEEILNVILFEYHQHTVLLPENIINSYNIFDTKSKAVCSRKRKISMTTAKPQPKKVKVTNNNFSFLEPIEMEKYPKPFESYHPEFVETFKQHQEDNNIKISLPGIKSNMGQAIALMTDPENRGKKYTDRIGSDKFLKQLGYDCKDSIQAFNKIKLRIGLQFYNIKGKYCAQYPFKFSLLDILKRKGCSISGDRNQQIDAIKQYHLQYVNDNIVDVPNDDWQKSHLDPHKPDSTENNLAYHPPIQSKHRDLFKFTRMFEKKCPTANELARNFLKYYETKQEIEVLYEAIKAIIEEFFPEINKK